MEMCQGVGLEGVNFTTVLGVANFLLCIGDLVQGLTSSKDDTASAEAIRKADDYLQSSREAAEENKQHSGTDRTVVNKSSSEKEGKQIATSTTRFSTISSSQRSNPGLSITS